MAAPEGPASPALALHPCMEPGVVVLRVYGSLDPEGVPNLCRRVCALLDKTDATTVLCDVGGMRDQDAVAVDALARLQLVLRRTGRTLWLRKPSRHLRELLTVTGLADVLRVPPRLCLDAGRESEQGEQGLSIEEENDPGDAIV